MSKMSEVKKNLRELWLSWDLITGCAVELDDAPGMEPDTELCMELCMEFCITRSPNSYTVFYSQVAKNTGLLCGVLDKVQR